MSTDLTAKELKPASDRPTTADKQTSHATNRPTTKDEQATFPNHLTRTTPAKDPPTTADDQAPHAIKRPTPKDEQVTPPNHLTAPAGDRTTTADDQAPATSDRITPENEPAQPANKARPTFVGEEQAPAVYPQTQTSTQSIPSSKPPATWLECEGGRERKRIAFPKNHKVAGSTVMTILSRYAYTRNLNVIIPRPFVPSKMYPYRLYPENYMPPPPNQTFDMLMYHTVYNRTRFREILPKDTVYVTIIRKPLNHLKSAWTFYNYGKLFRINETVMINSLARFLTNPGRYDKRCGHGIHYPLCLTQNSISTDLGFPPEYNKNVTLGSDPNEREKISRAFVQSIDNDFDLVMLTEYFDESLVLLKRLMCWTIPDILYIKSTNIQRRKLQDISPELKQKHKEWSYVDYALYDHFNKSFWKRAERVGKSLGLTSHNASFYGYNATGNINANVKMQETWQNRMVMKSVEPYCVYCKMNSCKNLDYLAHFYRDGYVGKEQYQTTKQILCNQGKQSVRTRN
ncbi:Galactose-3-O-sulfotransferase [Branchiostoma belcheri]|nr:Galactose-3-O-sulfotransferase [Branchiostoma belcheri]